MQIKLIAEHEIGEFCERRRECILFLLLIVQLQSVDCSFLHIKRPALKARSCYFNLIVKYNLIGMRISFLLLIALWSIIKVNSQFFGKRVLIKSSFEESSRFNLFLKALEVDGVFDKCCNMGSSMNSCDKKFFDIRREIPEKLHDLCRTSIDLCCEKKLQENNCKAGRDFARNKSTCVSNSKQSEMFKVI